MVAWRDHSIKALETTLDWLVHLLNATGVVAIWVGPPEQGAQQRLKLVLERLGFRIEFGQPHRIGHRDLRPPRRNRSRRQSRVIAC